MAVSAPSIASTLVPNSIYEVRKAFRIPTPQGVQQIVWMDGSLHDIFCLFRSELALPADIVGKVNEGSLALKAIYRGLNPEGEHTFDILNPATGSFIRVYMEVLN